MLEKLRNREARIGIIGLGYVGLPLSQAFIAAGFTVVGFDIDGDKIRMLTAGKTYIQHIGDATIEAMNATGRFSACDDFAGLGGVDAILICVPTPLKNGRDPDLGPVLATGETIARYLQNGQLVVLESSTYPGTTDTELAGVLEKSGLRTNQDYFLAYSPEREDPGNIDYSTSTIPKIVGADTQEALALAVALYEGVISNIVPVGSARTAEAAKLTENIFRAVNIAMVNELKMVFERMDIDIWDVIDAAATKPFGFMPFYPGPGLGGHCIPIDPFYLTWKAHRHGIETRFIELAGEINTAMPTHVVKRMADALHAQFGKQMQHAEILMIGMAYKKNIADMRESPALVLTELIEAKGAICAFHDPHVPVVPVTRTHAALAGRRSVELTEEQIVAADCVLIVTDHAAVDYELLGDKAKLIVDTRNAMAAQAAKCPVVKA